MRFLDRQRELQALHHLYTRDTAGLLILFGRRRVGKTRPLTHFLEQQDVPAFYWTATTHGSAYQLRAFSQAIMAYDPRFSSPPSPDFAFGDWEAAFHHLADVVAAADRPHLVVLDEFTYLLRNEPALASVLQTVWDHRLSQVPQFRLVLTGSLVGMMAREIFSYQAPLYGRATAHLRLRPLPYASLLDLFGDRPGPERVNGDVVAANTVANMDQGSIMDQLGRMIETGEKNGHQVQDLQAMFAEANGQQKANGHYIGHEMPVEPAPAVTIGPRKAADVAEEDDFVALPTHDPAQQDPVAGTQMQLVFGMSVQEAKEVVEDEEDTPKAPPPQQYRQVSLFDALA